MQIKKSLSALLVVAVIFLFCPALGLTSNEDVEISSDTSGITAGMKVYYGTYPQSEYTPLQLPDLPEAGATYIDTDGTSFVYNAYQGGSYFKIEPIEWRVIENANGELLLLSEKLLEARSYHSSWTSITWKDSAIRQWLNNATDGFVSSAFSEEERANIVTTSVQNPDNPRYSTTGGNLTNNKIFLLSIQEATTDTYDYKYFPDNDSRKALNTDYSVSTGAYDYSGLSHWHLRSPGQDGSYMAVANRAGNVDADGARVDNADIAIRPAFKLNLSSVIHASAAIGGKSSIGVTDVIVGTSTLTDTVKFSFLDNNIATPALILDDEATDGGVITFDYSGATTGTNKYISCILKRGGNIAYYGKLVECYDIAKASGSLTIDLSGIECDLYTLTIFGEQVDDAFSIDFVGSGVSFELMVDAGGNVSLVRSNISVTASRDGNHVTAHVENTGGSITALMILALYDDHDRLVYVLKETHALEGNKDVTFDITEASDAVRGKIITLLSYGTMLPLTNPAEFWHIYRHALLRSTTMIFAVIKTLLS